jgi:hypothetical protein
MKYRLSINDKEFFVENTQQLEELLNASIARGASALELTQIVDRKLSAFTKLWGRLFKQDMSILNERNTISGVIDNYLAFIRYSEELGNIYQSIDPAFAESDEMVEFALPNETARQSRDRCISKDLARKAFLEFHQTGVKPSCVLWQTLFDASVNKGE